MERRWRSRYKPQLPVSGHSRRRMPVPKNDYLEKEHQPAYTQWIEKNLGLDRRNSKDPQLCCGYCDVNNHPRFACKRAFKHQMPSERHRCTLCTGHHPPCLRSRAQIKGGEGKPIGTRSSISVQSRRLGNLIVDGRRSSSNPAGFSTLGSQSPSEAPQPQRAATTMMRGSSSGSIKLTAGRLSSNCRTSRMVSSSAPTACDLSESRIQIEANIWHLDVKEILLAVQGPIASCLAISLGCYRIQKPLKSGNTKKIKLQNHPFPVWPQKYEKNTEK